MEEMMNIVIICCMYLHHSMAHGRGEGGSPINLIGGSWIQNSGTNGRLGGDSQGCWAYQRPHVLFSAP